LNRLNLCLLLILLLAACAPLAPTGSPAATGASVPPSPSPLPPQPSPTLAGVDPASLENGTYTLAVGENLQVTMLDGKFKLSDAAKNLNISGQLIDPPAFGDLNGDGLQDAAVIVAANFGGSGTFHELFVVLAQKGPVASLALGDRIQEKLLSIQNGTITLDYLRSGPKDPLCCPSEHAVTTFQFKNNTLQKVSDQVLP
jgi:hypothetical protein